MYKSPIELFETPWRAIVEEKEDRIFAKVQCEFGVKVDKEELIRALQYDRGQYEKGYREGRADAVAHGRWIDDDRCSECGWFIPTDSRHDFIEPHDCRFCYNCGARMDLEV